MTDDPWAQQPPPEPAPGSAPLPERNPPLGGPSSPWPSAGPGSPPPHPGYPLQPAGLAAPGEPSAEGYPPGYPPTFPPATSRRTDGFAITALVLGVLSFVAILIPFAIGFGIAALVRISRRGSKGKGLAIAGIGLAVVWAIAWSALVAFAVAHVPDRDSSGAITKSGSLPISEIRAGDCIKDFAEKSVATVTVTPCTQPHHAEAFAKFELSGTTFPGTAKAAGQAESGCAKRAPKSFAALDQKAISFGSFSPDASNWTSGDHAVTCIIVSAKVALTAPLTK